MALFLILASFELSMTAIAVDTLFDEIRNVSESETKHGGSEKSFRLRGMNLAYSIKCK